MNTNTDILRQPSGWRRVLLNGALGELTPQPECVRSFSKIDMCMRIVRFVSGVIELLFWIASIVLMAFGLLRLVAIVLYVSLVGRNVEPLWPIFLCMAPFPAGILLFGLGRIVSRIYRRSCALIARLACPAELEYTKMTNQAQLQEKPDESHHCALSRCIFSQNRTES